MEAVKSALEEKKIDFEVVISDIQRAINDENPLSEDDIDELVGRKGMLLFKTNCIKFLMINQSRFIFL